MATETSGLDRIVETMRQPIQHYSDLVRQLAGSKALSLTVFAALAAGTFDKKLHTVRNVLVLSSVDLEMLRSLGEHGAKLGKARISAPLIMTPEYIKASLDTFPLELLEIQQCHITLFGEDHFDGLTFENTHIRHESERELKSILIGMRQGLLASTGREKFIGAIGVDATERLIRTLRGLLWLKGQKEGQPAQQVVSQAETVVGQTLIGVRTALNPNEHHGWDEFRILYKDVETLGNFADAS